MIKIVLEFDSVDAAISALGKLVGVSTTPKQPRKGRDDKGTRAAPTSRVLQKVRPSQHRQVE
jgi:hypothetical protein